MEEMARRFSSPIVYDRLTECMRTQDPKASPWAEGFATTRTPIQSCGSGADCRRLPPLGGKLFVPTRKANHYDLALRASVITASNKKPHPAKPSLFSPSILYACLIECARIQDREAAP